MSARGRHRLERLAEQAARDLEGAQPLRGAALGVGHLRRRAVRVVVDDRRGARPPRRPGAARRRGVLPGHRLPLRRDDRHPGRGRRDAAGQRAHGPSAADGGRAGRRPAPRLHDRDPDRCCWLRKVEPLGRALAPYAPGSAGAPGRVADPGGHAGGRRGTPARRWSRCTRLACWTQDDVDAYVAEQRRAGQPAGCTTATRRSAARRAPGRVEPGEDPAVRPLGRHREDRVRDPRVSRLLPRAGVVDFAPGEGGRHPGARRGAVRRAGGGRRGRLLRGADRRAAVVAAQPADERRVRVPGAHPPVPGAGAGAGSPRPARGSYGASRPGRRSTCTTRRCPRRSTRALGPAQKKLFLFRPERMALSLDRLAHYTGTPGRVVPALRAVHQLRHARRGVPGALPRRRGPRPRRAPDAGLAPPRRPGDGVSIVDIGVGPSNAKTVTDHVAVLRPDAC